MYDPHLRIIIANQLFVFSKFIYNLGWSGESATDKYVHTGTNFLGERITQSPGHVVVNWQVVLNYFSFRRIINEALVFSVDLHPCFNVPFTKRWIRWLQLTVQYPSVTVFTCHSRYERNLEYRCFTNILFRFVYIWWKVTGFFFKRLCHLLRRETNYILRVTEN
jgi:hypothetical protein